jgi:hypothetical protein
MEKTTRLDRVSIFGGKLSFLIPHEWIEEVEGDNYLYHEPGTDSGWLRVSLITLQNADETPTQGLSRIFEGKADVTSKSKPGIWSASLRKILKKKVFRSIFTIGW